MADIDYARTTKWYHFLGDFLNTLKAFIGTNYQALPFAFANSGLGFGIAGVFIVATLTDHCCQLLVSNKDVVVDEICDEDVASGRVAVDDVPLLRERLLRSIGYGDLGRRVLGRWSYQLIQILIWFTQFSTCVGYFIFIGNTVYQIFPLELIWFPLRNGSNINTSEFSTPSYTSGYSNGSHTTMLPPNTTERFLYKSTAPPLQYIILFPLPLFLCTSMIRRVRVIAPLSSIATVALFLGAAAVAGYLLVGFSVTEFCWYKFATLPLFLSQIISAYEGIGCILPIQSSMVGHRHLFTAFLHANIYLIFFILCFFGIVGYLRYGDSVSQIIVTEITQHTPLSILVDATLIVSVLFTYPLQCFPVIEIMEAYLLTPGKCCKSKSRRRLEFDEIEDADDDDVRESRGLIDSIDVSATEVSAVVSPTVPAWKRNILRVILTLIIAGFAVLLRNNFAYLAAFTGAVGCTSLAYILPCVIDIRLRRRNLSWFAVAKDVCIIIFGSVVSILALVAIIRKIVMGQRIRT